MFWGDVRGCLRKRTVAGICICLVGYAETSEFEIKDMKQRLYFNWYFTF